MKLWTDSCGRRLVVAGFLAGCGAAPVFAQTDAQALQQQIAQLRQDFDAVKRQYGDRLTALEAQLAASQGGQGDVAPAIAAPAPAIPADQAGSQVPAGASKVFNPDTAVIGNFVGVAGKNPLSEQPALSMSEVEASFQAVVDPFARADFFLSATPEGLEVEEGFVTFTSLPGSLLLKVGKMRASFGKVNTLHAHALPTSDRPLVTGNLVGGEEGLSDSGLSLSKLILNPLMYLEATGEVFRGESAVFQSSQRSRLNYLGRLRAYRDVSEGANLDLGTSVAYGPTDVGIDTNKRLIGVDATFRYRPLRRAIYKRFQARTEFLWSRQDVPAGVRQNAFGMYGLGEYQFARQWYFGARYDQSERALDASLKDRGGSLFLTFWPSEFSQIRAQYRRTHYAEGTAANEVLFQFRFGIGAHAAHVF